MWVLQSCWGLDKLREWNVVRGVGLLALEKGLGEKTEVQYRRLDRESQQLGFTKSEIWSKKIFKFRTRNLEKLWRQ